ncbi:Long-chain-fatty-acid--CoA ligase OS=Tsukamurella paurometabola OX=2061 GN=fadD_7 PE=4 SV=1 [Tsukamurella paurometabola]|nr:Long-chain-fatty-acid--CoA ligase [Tsukamurella paurometabola]
MDDLHREPLAGDILLHSLDAFPDRTAVHVTGPAGDSTLTYAQVRDEISRYAQAYAEVGLGVGSPVAMLSGNRHEVLIAQSTNLITGARFAALHPMGSLDDHVYVMEDAGIETLIYDPRIYEQRAADLRERVPGLKNLLSLGPTEVGTDLTEAAARFDPAPLAAHTADPSSTASLAYTGGTTGKSKGVMLSYAGGAALLRIQRAEWDWPQEIRFLVCAPLSHAGGAFWNPTAMSGGSMVVLPRFEPEAVLAAIEKYRITATMLVPTMLYALLDHPKFGDYDLSSLETVFYGASAISPSRLAEAIDRMGPKFFQFYGQAECPMTIAVLDRDDHAKARAERPERLASCGRPVPWVHVALLDDDGNRVPAGEPGEICVRGPLVMQGYLNKPEQTAEATAHEWLHTGDVGRFDEEGFLYIVDRKKDMVVTGGFNVFPREVEDVISTDPSVAAVAVIGVPDEKWGEAVTAVVVPRDGADVDVEALRELVRERKGRCTPPRPSRSSMRSPSVPWASPTRRRSAPASPEASAAVEDGPALLGEGARTLLRVLGCEDGQAEGCIDAEGLLLVQALRLAHGAQDGLNREGAIGVHQLGELECLVQSGVVGHHVADEAVLQRLRCGDVPSGQ